MKSAPLRIPLCVTCGYPPATLRAHGQTTCDRCESHHVTYEAATAALAAALAGPLRTWAEEWLARGLDPQELREIATNLDWTPPLKADNTTPPDHSTL